MKKILVAFVFIMLIAWPASGAMNDSDRASWAKFEEIGALTNCSNASINSAVTCGGDTGIRVEGYNAITLEISYTKDAGTGYQFYVETCYEGQATTNCTDATDWHRITVESASITEVYLTAVPFVHVATASDRITYTLGMNYKRIRLAGFVATGTPSANDKITVNARIGWLQSF